jgi:hypothetical protein
VLNKGLNVNGPDVLTDGVVWRPEWVCDDEGPYTRLAKVTLANAEGLAFACQHIMGKRHPAVERHGHFYSRTLLTSGWMNTGANRAHALASDLPGATLDRRLGGWWRSLASDDALRYCPSCLSVGFQSALNQIAALRCCPTHGDLLLDRCQRCSQPTPPYALSRAFDTPGVCDRCHVAFADCWNSVGATGKWREGAQCAAGYQMLARLLAPIRETELRWPTVSAWTPGCCSGTAEHKLAVFEVLRNLLGLKIPSDLLNSVGTRVAVQTLDTSPPTVSESRTHARTAIVKSIRRHLLRDLNRDRRNRAFIHGNFVGDLHSRQVIPTVRGPASVHGVLTWLMRFGAWPFDEQFRRQRYSVLSVPAELLNWPGQAQISNRSWGHFAWACLHADRASAEEWRLHLSDCQQGADVPRHRWMQLSHRFKAALSASANVAPPGTTQLQLKSGAFEQWIAYPIFFDRGTDSRHAGRLQ